MHKANIEVLRSEAQRLLRLNIEGLEQMMVAKGIITEAESGSQQTFDRTSTPKYIEVLKGELTKLENMELVIAVVGTMKAGKSTTINAIVGTEVLPNRNRPMTALPTLIRHTLGQVEPILKFENNEPINVLFESIRQHIATGKVNQVLKSLSDDSDMCELIGLINNKGRFRKDYQGSENIFWCLKTLNDLVRLSSTLGVDFPFSSYSNVGQMPVITVEFAHLREAGKTHGQLTLLDTPGPNEAGQEHLRDMLTEQLKKTSAVLAVFDYTQLKSDADEQVRAEIKSIAKLHTGRLFALVNKFDQKDRNGDGKEAVQTLVADTLMSGLLDKKHVFPVSSMLGYLANHAKQQMSTNNKLPDYNKESWVKDFAEKAFGSSWEDDDLSDNDAVTKAAEKLWKKSGFYDPMENVIRAAHSQAALLALDSASEKLAMYTNEIENFLGSRHGSLSQSAEALKNRIAVLKENITNIERIEKDAKDKIESTLNRLMKDSEETIENSKKKIKANLEKYFEEGKRVEEKEIATRQREADSKRSASPLDLIFSGLRDATAQSRQDFDPNRPIITFSKESDADELLEGVKESVIKEIKDNQSILDRDIEKSLKNVGIDFAKNVNSAEAIIATIQAEMSGEGFKVNLKSPNTDKLNPIFRNSNFSLAAESTTREESYRVEKDGIGSWFARKLWGGGYETRYRDVKEFIIDIAEIKKTVEGNIEKTFDGYKSEIDREVIKPLNAEVNKFFIDLKATIEKIKSNLEQGIKDQQKDQVGIDTLKKNLEQFLKDVPDLKEDNECLTHDIKVLIHKKNKVAA